MAGSAGAVPPHAGPSTGPGTPETDLYIYIRPSEWASALAGVFEIPVEDASSILAEVADGEIEATGMAALAELWERSVLACARHMVHREVAAGTGLGYFRWQRRPGGRRVLGGTELAASVGIWQVSRDLATAAGTTMEAEVLGGEAESDDDSAGGTFY